MSPALSSPASASPAPRKPSIPPYVPLLLGLPALIPLAWSCFRAWANGLLPTGFIQYDMAYYMANARQHFANGFHLAYSNPYAAYGSPAIYFQPHILLLAVLEKTGLDPGIAFNLFGLAALAFATTVAARLYQEVVGWETLAHKLGLVCFFWGGGVLSLAGLAFGVFTGVGAARASLLFDAGDGWWMFNFGRNLVYPTEAYYHGVFLLTLLMLMRKRRGIALALTALLAASHPFTGLSLSLIVAIYAAVEVFLSSGVASKGLLLGACAIVAGHLSYYQLFLNRFADHRALRSQWELDWPYAAWTFGPALYIMGFLAFLSMSRWPALKRVLANPRMRLFLVCFAVIFGLTQHDLFVKPVQPLHFAHGYDWIALFFLAAPALVKLLDRMLNIERRLLRFAAVTVILIWILSDNLLWFASFRDPAVQSYAISLTRDQRGVLDWLRQHGARQAIVVSSDEQIGYLTSTYSDLRSWYGHVHNTPHAAERKQTVEAVFHNGAAFETTRAAYFIPLAESRWMPPAGSNEVYRNGSYVVWYAESNQARSKKSDAAGSQNDAGPQR